MKENKDISEFIDFCLTTNKNIFNKNEIFNHKELIKMQVLMISNNDTVEINPKSLLLGKELLKKAETELNKTIPKNVIKAFDFIKEYFKVLRDKTKFSNLILKENLKFYTLHTLHKTKEVNVINSFIKIVNEDNFNGSLSSFENDFFKVLPFIINDAKEIFDLVNKTNSGQTIDYFINRFYSNLSHINLKLAKELYNLYSKTDIEYKNSLLRGLYNFKQIEYFKEILNLNRLDMYNTLSSINIKNREHLIIALDVVKTLELEEIEISKAQTYLISHLIRNTLCTTKEVNILWTYLRDLIIKAKEEISEHIMFNIINHIEGFDNIKYKLLHLFIPKTKKLHILNRFFDNIKSPFYLFDWLISHIKANRKPQIRIFENAFSNLRRNDLVSLENEILNFFNFGYKFGIIAIDIIQVNHNDFIEIDLCKIKTKEAQMNAIFCFCNYSNNFDKLLPILLQLRFSIYKEVIEYLQEQLSVLIIDVYGKGVMEMIHNSIKIRKNDKFLSPLKKALKIYTDIKNYKQSINDINPFENEKSYMNLYFNLEHESKAKMMEEKDGENNFLDFVTKKTVALANSYKNEYSKEVTKLALFEFNMMVDIRIYRNSDLNEIQETNLWTLNQ